MNQEILEMANQLDKNGHYQETDALMNKISQVIWSYKLSDEELLDKIKEEAKRFFMKSQNNFMKLFYVQIEVEQSLKFSGREHLIDQAFVLVDEACNEVFKEKRK